MFVFGMPISLQGISFVIAGASVATLLVWTVVDAAH